MHLLRTVFKNEIVAEFLPPRKDSNKVVILCDGLPSMPAKQKLVKFLAKKNFWVFHPRYRGSWESLGEFLDKSPERDIFDIIDSLDVGFVDLYNDEVYRIENPEIFVFGASFGGTCALLTSLDSRVKKVVAAAPVVDWRKISQDDFAKEYNFIRQAFAGAYRYKQGREEELRRGRFFNPINYLTDYQPEKILIIHAQDDDLVPFAPAQEFAQKIGCRFLNLRSGGHLSSSIFRKWKIFRKINKFIKT